MLNDRFLLFVVVYINSDFFIMFGGITKYMCEKCEYITVSKHDCGKDIMCLDCGTWYADKIR